MGGPYERAETQAGAVTPPVMVVPEPWLAPLPPPPVCVDWVFGDMNMLMWMWTWMWILIWILMLAYSHMSVCV